MMKRKKTKDFYVRLEPQIGAEVVRRGKLLGFRSEHATARFFLCKGLGLEEKK